MFSQMSIELYLIIIIGIIGVIVQGRLQSVFTKYSRIPFPGGMTGKEVAEKMLYDSGVHDVKVTATKGRLTDNYDPRTKTVNLSEGVYESRSIAAAAVAAHECGHAIQDATHYGPLRLRRALVPVITFTSQWAFIVIIMGLFVIRTFPALYWIGILMIAMSAIFSLVTLPVEYNASNRAMAWLDSTRLLSTEQRSQAKTALSWAARTYLVAALSAVVTLFYFLSLGSRRQ